MEAKHVHLHRLHVSPLSPPRATTINQPTNPHTHTGPPDSLNSRVVLECDYHTLAVHFRPCRSLNLNRLELGFRVDALSRSLPFLFVFPLLFPLFDP